MDFGLTFLRKSRRIAYFMLLGGEALVQLCLTSLIVRCVPFARYSKFLDRSAFSAGPPANFARDLRRMIEYLSPLLPRRSQCLICAIAAKTILARRGYASTLSLGVIADEQPMRAHAWLVADSIIVTGRRQMADFTEVARL